MEPIVNKVAESGLLTINPETYLPPMDAISIFDIKPFLFMEMILKEKDFRAALPGHDWQQYAGRPVAIINSADAIIPMWAYMLIVTYLQPVDAKGYFGTAEEVKERLLLENIRQINADDYRDKRIVIRGCGDQPIPEAAFVAITQKLLPVAKSIMYGEPCSTVPVYKRK